MKNSIKNKIIVGRPFVGHVDQSARPELAVSFLLTHNHNHDMNIINSGVYKLMGYAYDFRPFLKQYVYKQYGQWHEAYAINKTYLRKITYGIIDKIIEQ